MKKLFNRDAKYINSIDANGIFDNSYSEKMPQYIINKAILSHFKKSEKNPKCLFIGWDGCRCDAMRYIVKSTDAKISGANDNSIYSAVCKVKENGGMYITYVGGDKGSEQETSTAQGWCSALCGKWVKNNWKNGIEWGVDDDYPTALRTLSEQGYKTSFNAEWPIHFSNTYLYEIEYAQKNNLSESFFNLDDDVKLFEHMKQRIKSDDDFIFGIFENPDANGHSLGFGDSNYRYVSGVCNLDRISYELLRQVKARRSFEDEDWLIVIASDHGGHSVRHGTQKIEDRTTFLALSKPIKELV